VTTIPDTHPKAGAAADGTRPVLAEMIASWRPHLRSANGATRAGRRQLLRGLAR